MALKRRKPLGEAPRLARLDRQLGDRPGGQATGLAQSRAGLTRERFQAAVTCFSSREMPDGIRWVGLDVHARESTFAVFDRLWRDAHQAGDGSSA